MDDLEGSARGPLDTVRWNLDSSSTSGVIETRSPVATAASVVLVALLVGALVSLGAAIRAGADDGAGYASLCLLLGVGAALTAWVVRRTPSVLTATFTAGHSSVVIERSWWGRFEQSDQEVDRTERDLTLGANSRFDYSIGFGHPLRPDSVAVAGGLSHDDANRLHRALLAFLGSDSLGGD